jgi:hypothetical protein
MRGAYQHRILKVRKPRQAARGQDPGRSLFAGTSAEEARGRLRGALWDRRVVEYSKTICGARETHDPEEFQSIYPHIVASIRRTLAADANKAQTVASRGFTRPCVASSPRQWIWLGGGTQNALFLLMAELREQGIVSRRGALARPDGVVLLSIAVQ